MWFGWFLLFQTPLRPGSVPPVPPPFRIDVREKERRMRLCRGRAQRHLLREVAVAVLLPSQFLEGGPWYNRMGVHLRNDILIVFVPDGVIVYRKAERGMEWTGLHPGVGIGKRITRMDRDKAHNKDTRRASAPFGLADALLRRSNREPCSKPNLCKDRVFFVSLFDAQLLFCLSFSTFASVGCRRVWVFFASFLCCCFVTQLLQLLLSTLLPFSTVAHTMLFRITSFRLISCFVGSSSLGTFGCSSYVAPSHLPFRPPAFHPCPVPSHSFNARGTSKVSRRRRIRDAPRLTAAMVFCCTLPFG